MADNPPSKRRCLGADCANDAGDLQCPTFLKIGMKDSYFCSQNCFKRNWNEHKTLHTVTTFYNPFSTYSFTGPLRPVYPLSPRRPVPESIMSPDYAETGIPKRRPILNSTKVNILDAKGQEAMRKVCRLAREVLDIVAAELRPGITTDYLDEVCHQACIERNNLDSDIVNLDVTLYHEGYHADLNETYYVGDRAKADPDSVRVVETARECLNEAIKYVKPGTPIRKFGSIIEKHAKSRNCNVVKNGGGHGINTLFHCPPYLSHYSNNKSVGVCKPGMTFTIEPIIALGKYRDVTWPDNWTNTTIDGKRTAQFEHTVLVTKIGVEVLTAGNESSPGGPVPMPKAENRAS